MDGGGGSRLTADASARLLNVEPDLLHAVGANASPKQLMYRRRGSDPPRWCSTVTAASDAESANRSRSGDRKAADLSNMN
eukprot:3385908-Pyramimonas_sp.AAC.1